MLYKKEFVMTPHGSIFLKSPQPPAAYVNEKIAKIKNNQVKEDEHSDIGVLETVNLQLDYHGPQMQLRIMVQHCPLTRLRVQGLPSHQNDHTVVIAHRTQSG